MDCPIEKVPATVSGVVNKAKITAHEFLRLNGWDGPYEQDTAIGTFTLWKVPDWAEGDEWTTEDDALQQTFERNYDNGQKEE